MRPSGARLVAIGILASRLFGLVRQKAFAFFFGLSPLTDVLNTAFRLPNVIQNLLGEQSLSAAFIPIYSRLVEDGKQEDARRLAGAVFGLLLGVISLLVLGGILFARPIVLIGAAGYLQDAARVASSTMDVDRLELTVRAVRIIFPMTGLLALSAFCLGVLNSHRRFLLSYMAPVLWNAAIIGVLVAAAFESGFLAAPDDAPHEVLERWLFAVFLGGLLGGLLQFLVQLPLVWRLLGGLRPSWDLGAPGVRDCLRMFGPAVMGRGVVQLAFYVNIFLTSFLEPGAPGALAFAMMLFNLPLSAFGMSVAAAELPELARAGKESDETEEATARVRERLQRAIRQSAFVMAPATVGYVAFGLLVTGLIYGGGSFTFEDNVLVALVLGAASLGLLAAATSRILQNTFFALQDTRTPALVAGARLAVGSTLGVVLMLLLDLHRVRDVFGLSGGTLSDRPLFLGAVGLVVGGALADWAELFLLRRQLRRRLPGLTLPSAAIARMLALALASALPAAALWWWLAPRLGTVGEALVVLPFYATPYLLFAAWKKWPELGDWLGRFQRRRVQA